MFGDSQLVSNQISGDYNAKDERIAAYLALVKKLMTSFEEINIQQFPRGQNSHADALEALSSAVDSSLKRVIPIDFLICPSINHNSKLLNVEQILQVGLAPSWMDPLKDYLKEGTLREDKKTAHQIRIKAARFHLSTRG